MKITICGTPKEIVILVRIRNKGRKENCLWDV